MITNEQRLAGTEKILERKIVGPRWVGVSAIKEVTGWDFRKMRWARDNNVVLIRERNGRYEYDINSIPIYFIKQEFR